MLPSNDTLTQTAQIIAAESSHVRQPEFALMGFCNRYLRWLYQTYGVKDSQLLSAKADSLSLNPLGSRPSAG